MWHLCRSTSRPLIGVCYQILRQRPLNPVQIKPNSQRLLSFKSLFKIKKDSEVPSQPPVNPRHPPDYVPPRSAPLPPPPPPTAESAASKSAPSQSNIFARFRHAYAKYGKILIAVHFVSSWAWLSGLILLHFKGLDLGMYIIDGLERIHIISSERRLSFIRHMNEFSVSGIISRIPFISNERREQLNVYWTGERVRLLATALLLYKFLTPIRYAFTLGATTYISRTFLKRGLIKRAPQGDSLQELYRDQKQLIKSHVRRARDKIQKPLPVRRGTHKSE